VIQQDQAAGFFSISRTRPRRTSDTEVISNQSAGEFDPDPQTPGTFSLANMIGNFDVLPGRDPGTGARTGLTPQSEQHATNWTIDLIEASAALAKASTGRTQLINALSAADGYGSFCCHSTHSVGMDVDLHTDSSTWDNGDGVVDGEEQKVISHAIAFMTAAAPGRVTRILTSNDDILDGINAFRLGTAVYDSSNVHLNHLHLDVAPPVQLADVPNLLGDFNLDDVVDAADYTVWRDGLGTAHVAADYNIWKPHFGATAGSGSAALSTVQLAVPEPATLVLALATASVWVVVRRRRAGYSIFACISRFGALA